MGRHRRRVRCGTCYAVGHNKRSCPVYTDRLKRDFERLQESLKAATPSSFSASWQSERLQDTARELITRTGVDPFTNQKVKKRPRNKNVRCSYCRYKDPYSDELGFGHTRAKCELMKQDTKDAYQNNIAFREGVLENLRRHGIGIGSIIGRRATLRNPRTQEFELKDLLYFVVGVNWDKINLIDSHSIFTLQAINFEKAGARMDLPMMVTEDGEALSFSGAGEWVVNERGHPYGSWPVDGANEDGFYMKSYVGKRNYFRVSPAATGTINPPPNWIKGRPDSIAKHFKCLKRNRSAHIR